VRREDENESLSVVETERGGQSQALLFKKEGGDARTAGPAMRGVPEQARTIKFGGGRHCMGGEGIGKRYPKKLGDRRHAIYGTRKDDQKNLRWVPVNS